MTPARRPMEAPPNEPASSGRTLVLVGTFLMIATMLAVPLRSWFAQRADLDELRADIAARQSDVDALSAEQKRWLDPLYVAEQARLRLNLVLPGEAALIAFDRQTAAVDRLEQAPPTTWYGRLWQSTGSVAGSDPASSSDDGG